MPVPYPVLRHRTERETPMRLTVIAPLLALLALVACAPSVGGPGADNYHAECAEQSAMAQNGTTDGGLITITCP